MIRATCLPSYVCKHFRILTSSTWFHGDSVKTVDCECGSENKRKLYLSISMVLQYSIYRLVCHLVITVCSQSVSKGFALYSFSHCLLVLMMRCPFSPPYCVKVTASIKITLAMLGHLLQYSDLSLSLSHCFVWQIIIKNYSPILQKPLEKCRVLHVCCCWIAFIYPGNRLTP